MHVIAARTLRDFASETPRRMSLPNIGCGSRTLLVGVLHKDVVASFPSSKVINAERLRSELVGNTFRLVCRINDRSGAVFIVFLGTHGEYDAIDARTVSMF